MEGWQYIFLDNATEISMQIVAVVGLPITNFR
jgi:hypothetical protein